MKCIVSLVCIALSLFMHHYAHSAEEYENIPLDTVTTQIPDNNEHTPITTHASAAASCNIIAFCNHEYFDECNIPCNNSIVYCALPTGGGVVGVATAGITAAVKTAPYVGGVAYPNIFGSYFGGYCLITIPIGMILPGLAYYLSQKIIGYCKNKCST